MINIQDITPFMKKGWVAMDSNGEWNWYDLKPSVEDEYKWCNGLHGCAFDLCMFDIAPADDWTKSLISVGDKPNNKVFDVDEFYNEMFEND